MPISTDLGHGITLDFDSDFFDKITSISWTGISRPVINTSHFGTTGEFQTKKLGNLADPGQVRIAFQLNPNATPAILAGDAPATTTVTFTNAAGSTWAATMGMSEFSIDAPELTGLVTGSATLEVLSAITVTAAP